MSFRPDAAETFLQLFEANWQLIKAFEGCSHVELLRDENEPNVFFTYSHWQSEAHLNAYRDSPLFARVWGATKLLFNARPQAWTVKQLEFF